MPRDEIFSPVSRYVGSHIYTPTPRIFRYDEGDDEF